MMVGDCFKLSSLENNFMPVLRKLYSPPSSKKSFYGQVREIPTMKRVGMLEHDLELERWI